MRRRLGSFLDSTDPRGYLPLGKLCEHHGYSYEWTSGQKPHLIKHGRKIQCNTENYVPIVVSGVSGHPQHRHPDDATPCPATTRSWITRSRALGDQWRDSTETKNNNKSEDIERARGSPLRDLPEWLEEFTEQSVDEEASASRDTPASISREPPPSGDER